MKNNNTDQKDMQEVLDQTTKGNGFLPDNYEVPSSSDNYMKFIKGENKLRILTSPILGFVWWEGENGNRKPVRVPMGEAINIKDIDDPESVKHFWAMVVYNYQEKRIQILELTQKGIQKTLRALAKDEDWGSPVRTYDIVVTRSGDGMETRYEVLPKPAKQLDSKILEQFEAMNIDLNALYAGADPFSNGKSTT